MEIKAIAEALGGRRVLGRTIKRADDLAQLVRKGLPATSVSALAEKLDLANTVLSQKLGIPQRTLTRRLIQESRLTPAESDRTVRALVLRNVRPEVIKVIDQGRGRTFNQ